MRDLLLDGTPYASYAYAYPHKTAYRLLHPPLPLSEVWREEPKDALFLYFHIPFCEMRCGFCNLFTTSNPPDEMEAAYLDTFARQAGQVRAALGDSRFARMAFGGGTPTYLSEAGLARLLDIAGGTFGADTVNIPFSVETSPKTAERGKLTLLRERGVDRISIGIQSFHEAETVAVGRAQKIGLVAKALDAIRAAGFPTLNIDLMYGLPGQAAESWTESLRAALRWRPEELYLYPLYVRPLTGLGRSQREWDDERLAFYRLACELLASEGYTQVSMRMFRASHAPTETADDGPVYCTQEDGMVGVGCGARSYTRAVQYSSEYAVGKAGVRSIIEEYIARPDSSFASADFGIRLNADDQRRRYLIYSLLTAAGTDRAQYRAFFGSDALEDFPQLAELAARDWAVFTPDRLRLTNAGLERSDAIGPWLYSDPICAQMETFSLK